MFSHILLSNVLGKGEYADMVPLRRSAEEGRLWGTGTGNSNIESLVLGEEGLVYMVHGQNVLYEVSASVQVVSRVRKLDD